MKNLINLKNIANMLGLVLFALLLAIVPNPLSAQTNNADKQHISKNKDEAPSILCLILEMKSNDNDEEEIQLIRAVARPGRLKKEMDISLHGHTDGGGLVCSVLDADGKVLLEEVFPNPLVRSLEYEDELTGEMKRVEAPVEARHFLIRLPHSEEYAALRFERQDDAGNREFLSRIEWNL